MVCAIHGILELEPAYCSLCEKALSTREGCIVHITWLNLAISYMFVCPLSHCEDLKG